MIYWTCTEGKDKSQQYSMGDSINDINIYYNFKLKPAYRIGDEISFICVYNHETESDRYIIHCCVQDLVKFIICNDFPSLIQWIKKLHPLIDFHLLTDSIMENADDND